MLLLMLLSTLISAQVTEVFTAYPQKMLVSSLTNLAVDYIVVFEGVDHLSIFDASSFVLITKYANTDAYYNIKELGNFYNTGDKLLFFIPSKDKTSIKLVDVLSGRSIATFGIINSYTPMYAYVCATKTKQIKICVAYPNFLRLYSTNLTATSAHIDNPNEVPNTFSLSQNYPNPFNPSTSIKYNLTKQSDVQIHIYDINGRLVRELQDSNASAGDHIIIWDGKNNSGQYVSSGTYIYQLLADGVSEAKKMILLK